MKLLAYIDSSREGNDCFIYEEWSLVSVFDEKILMKIRKTNGWGPTDLDVVVYELGEDLPSETEQMLIRLKTQMGGVNHECFDGRT